ncbi:MAG: alpha-amylase family glycosyl hydrolase [Candidatus Cloacimonetes bacterium]|nr:alpha-amylase family glycosyl hydrolase [Candidatus Cloacimonadota bacterium]
MHEDQIKISFSYKPLTGGEHNVFLTGDFNNWEPDDIKLINNSGIYETEVKLSPGKYAYKYIVDGIYVMDESASEIISDGLGGFNSVITVGDDKEINAVHRIIITYKPDIVVTSVHIAGSFNHWNRSSDELEPDIYGNYSIRLFLKTGEYHYKFLLNGNIWTHDPNAEKRINDGFGGLESILKVDSRFPTVEFNRNDNDITTFGIYSSEQNFRHTQLIDEEQVEFRAKCYKNDVAKIFLLTKSKEIPLKIYAENGLFEYYSVVLPISKLEEEGSFCFCYEDGERKLFYNSAGFNEERIEILDFKYCLNELKKSVSPDWVKDGIIYQIFCDRFFNGSTDNDPDFSEWYYNDENSLSEAVRKRKYKLIKDWFDCSPLSGKNPDHYCFYGGDIKGVSDKIDYLADLGVSIIYFNPLCQAESNHKYDTMDYFKIDPHFGTNDEFRDFVKLCHEKGIKIIVDFAFNHTGIEFFAFKDAVENGEKSEYYSWYEWKGKPLPEVITDDFVASEYYQCWWVIPRYLI